MVTVQTLKKTGNRGSVLALFRRQPLKSHTGADVIQATGLGSSSAYKAIHELTDAGWLSPSWTEVSATGAARPVKCWQITEAGQSAWSDGRVGAAGE